MALVASYYKAEGETQWTRIDNILGLPLEIITAVEAVEASMGGNWVYQVIRDGAQEIIDGVYKDIGVTINVGINNFETKHIAYTLLGPTIDPIDEVIATHKIRCHQWEPGKIQISPSL